MAPSDEQSVLMADILANLGSFVLDKKEDTDPTKSRHSNRYHIFQSLPDAKILPQRTISLESIRHSYWTSN
jgi:hypothetical protein